MATLKSIGRTRRNRHGNEGLPQARAMRAAFARRFGALTTAWRRGAGSSEPVVEHVFLVA
jgi:hypothetical protein